MSEAINTYEFNAYVKVKAYSEAEAREQIYRAEDALGEVVIALVDDAPTVYNMDDEVLGEVTGL